MRLVRRNPAGHHYFNVAYDSFEDCLTTIIISFAIAQIRCVLAIGYPEVLGKAEEIERILSYFKNKIQRNFPKFETLLKSKWPHDFADIEGRYADRQKTAAATLIFDKTGAHAMLEA